MLGCVAAGFGVTLLPRCIVEDAWREGRLAIHELPQAEAQAETVFIRRRDGFVSRALASLLDHARRAPPLLVAAE
jgi:LysR family transcriptional regulator, cell division regulator